MKCAACGYDSEAARYVPEDEKPFIEIRGVEKGPFYKEVRSVYPDGSIGEYRFNTHCSMTTIEVGTEATLYACPICGTVKMEV